MIPFTSYNNRAVRYGITRTYEARVSVLLYFPQLHSMQDGVGLAPCRPPQKAAAAHLSYFYPLAAALYHIGCDKRLQVYIQSIPCGHQVLVVDNLEEGLQGNIVKLWVM